MHFEPNDRSILKSLAAEDPTILSSLLYFDLYNELHFDLSRPPLNRDHGVYIFENESYDLAGPLSRQRLMDVVGTVWMRTVVPAVVRFKPGLSITASTFTVSAFGHHGFDGGQRSLQHVREDPYPLQSEVLMRGGATLLDVHVYSAPSYNSRPASHVKALEFFESSGFGLNLTRRVPIVLGEFGSVDQMFKNSTQSIAEMRDTWNALCPLHTSGYALWALNGHMTNQPSGVTTLLQTFHAMALPCPGR